MSATSRPPQLLARLQPVSFVAGTELQLPKFAHQALGMKMEDLASLINSFSDERDWGQFHSPRNLVLALTGEVGELAELIQWIPDSGIHAFFQTTSQRDRFAEELADILIYALRLAAVTGIDPSASITKKLEANSLKYPVSKSYGSAEKRAESR